MDRLDFFQFNYEWYPDFDDSAKSAARDEIFHTLKTILEEELSIKHLLKSDFVVINDLLAEYYGIDGVEGHHFRSPSTGWLSTRRAYRNRRNARHGLRWGAHLACRTRSLGATQASA